MSREVSSSRKDKIKCSRKFNALEPTILNAFLELYTTNGMEGRSSLFSLEVCACSILFLSFLRDGFQLNLVFDFGEHI